MTRTLAEAKLPRVSWTFFFRSSYMPYQKRRHGWGNRNFVGVGRLARRVLVSWTGLQMGAKNARGLSPNLAISRAFSMNVVIQVARNGFEPSTKGL